MIGFFNSRNGRKIEMKIVTKLQGRGIMERGKFEAFPTNRQVATSVGDRATLRTGRLQTYPTRTGRVKNLPHVVLWQFRKK
jgi:hypothetical protein